MPGVRDGRECKSNGCNDIAVMRGMCDYCNQVHAKLYDKAPTRAVADAAWDKWVRTI